MMEYSDRKSVRVVVVDSTEKRAIATAKSFEEAGASVYRAHLNNKDSRDLFKGLVHNGTFEPLSYPQEWEPNLIWLHDNDSKSIVRLSRAFPRFVRLILFTGGDEIPDEPEFWQKPVPPAGLGTADAEQLVRWVSQLDSPLPLGLCRLPGGLQALGYLCQAYLESESTAESNRQRFRDLQDPGFWRSVLFGCTEPGVLRGAIEREWKHTSPSRLPLPESVKSLLASLSGDALLQERSTASLALRELQPEWRQARNDLRPDIAKDWPWTGILVVGNDVRSASLAAIFRLFIPISVALYDSTFELLSGRGEGRCELVLLVPTGPSAAATLRRQVYAAREKLTHDGAVVVVPYSSVVAADLVEMEIPRGGTITLGSGTGFSVVDTPQSLTAVLDALSKTRPLHHARWRQEVRGTDLHALYQEWKDEDELTKLDGDTVWKKVENAGIDEFPLPCTHRELGNIRESLTRSDKEQDAKQQLLNLLHAAFEQVA